MEREIRAASMSLNEKGKVEGYAIRYNERSLDLGGFVETIKPGAATDSLASNDILALYAHRDDAILGRTSSGTLELREDQQGVSYSLSLPNTQLGNDLKELIKRGDIKGASFGFYVPKGAESWSVRDGQKVRELSKVDVGEITLCASPAYPTTTAALRSLSEWDSKRARLKLRVRLAQVAA